MPTLAEELFAGRRTPSQDRASALYLSTQGEQPLADMLAGGDMDGDTFYVLQRCDLLEICGGGLRDAATRPTETPAAPPLVRSRIPLASPAPAPPLVQGAAPSLRRFTVTRRERLVGKTEVNHRRRPTSSASTTRCGRLAEVYMEALDGKGDVAAHRRIMADGRHRLSRRPKWCSPRLRRPCPVHGGERVDPCKLDSCNPAELKLRAASAR